MKQKDIVLIIVVVFISVVSSIILSKFLISTPENRQQQVEVVGSVSEELKQPDEKYFNKDSINPTQQIKIGGDENTKPFNKDDQNQ